MTDDSLTSTMSVYVNRLARRRINVKLEIVTFIVSSRLAKRVESRLVIDCVRSVSCSPQTKIIWSAQARLTRGPRPDGDDAATKRMLEMSVSHANGQRFLNFAMS